MKTAALLVSTALIASMGAAWAKTAGELTGGEPGIKIHKSTIERGRLIVEGTSSFGTQISLDGVLTDDLSPERVFRFSTLYRPADCRIRLSVVGNPSKFKEALVADCGPAGLTPRGAWVQSNSYERNDLVTYLGSSWRAKESIPAGSVSPGVGAFWDIFVASGGSGGTQGPQGAQGAQGADGAQGAQGADGAQGAQGADGAQGSQGAQGADGAAGTQGADGAAGPQGAAGAQGPMGTDGPIGPQGAAGATGPQGVAGAPGPTGADGAAGPQGANGATGPQGASGATGPQGAKGATGPQGPQGSSSFASVAAANGVVNFSGGDSAASYAFLGPTASVTVATGDIVLVDATAALGTTTAGGAVLARLQICYRQSGATDLAEYEFDYLENIRYPENSRFPATLSAQIDGLAGTYDVGLCYRAEAGQTAAWNNNDWLRVRAIVSRR